MINQNNMQPPIYFFSYFYDDFDEWQWMHFKLQPPHPPQKKNPKENKNQADIRKFWFISICSVFN